MTKPAPKAIPAEARGEISEVVEFRHTLTAHHEMLPPVYSTPDMIRLMETAAFLALHPYCGEGEITVGTAINVEHRAPAGVGANVKAEAWFESSDGRFYIMRVRAEAGGVEIGRGTVTRAFVHLEGHLNKANASGKTTS
jgi:predicted thioesterase